MKPTIKKGNTYLCLKDYVMYDDSIAYIEGKTYSADRDGNLPSEGCAYHDMNDEENFDEYFTQVSGSISTDVVSSSNTKDNINPDHYKQGKVECIDALEAATVNKTGIEAICTANVIKYLWRYESKNGMEDVKKAQWYLNKLVKHLENGREIN